MYWTTSIDAQRAERFPALPCSTPACRNVDGFGLAEEIKTRFGSGIPVVLLTSAQGGGDVSRCMELGIQAYLSKPIRQSELHEAIARILTITES